MAHSKQKQGGQGGDSCQEGWAQSRGPRTGAGGLTSGLTGLTDGPPRALFASRSSGGGSGAAGQAVPAAALEPELAPPAQPRRRVGEGDRRERDAGSQGRPSSRQRRAARGDFLQPARCWALNRVREARESHALAPAPKVNTTARAAAPPTVPRGSSTRLLAPRLPFRNSVSSLPSQQKLLAPSWSRAGARKGAGPPGVAGPEWLRGNREREGP